MSDESPTIIAFPGSQESMEAALRSQLEEGIARGLQVRLREVLHQQQEDELMVVK